MKINDLSNKEQTNEGFGDFINNYQANKQSAKSKQQDERAKAIGLKDFTYKLNSALQSAIKGGIVVAPSKQTTSTQQPAQNVMNSPAAQQLEKQRIAKQQSVQSQVDNDNRAITKESQYKLFNYLIENKILNEAAESVSQFITRFIDTQTRNLVDSPNYQQNIDMIAKKLEDSYIQNKKLDPGLIEQVWETIWAWSQLGNRRGQSNRQQSIDMDNDGVDDTDQREQLKINMIKILKNVDFNDPVKLKSIEPSIKGLLDMIQAIK